MKKLLSLSLALVLACSLIGCSGGNNGTSGDGETESLETALQENMQNSDTETASVEASETAESQTAAEASAAKPATDPSGASVQIPDEIESIVVLTPAVTEVLTALGCGDQIVAYDAQSEGLEGVPSDVPVFDMVKPDMEQLAALKPDLLFVSNLTMYDESNPYEQLVDMGICVLSVPSANSIAEIKESISFIAAAVGKAEEGEKLVSDMQAEIDRIAAVGQTITDKKSVYFEISAAPEMYSFGTGVFLNEMIELIGAENALADQQGWIRVEGETIAAANPDVILTNVNYIEEPVSEILSRSGWEGMNAIQNKQVYYIDNMSSSLSDQNIVKALDEMAKAVYPEYYGE